MSDHHYVVFCRLILGDLPNDLIAGIVAGLSNILSSHFPRANGRAIHSSVYGRFAVIPVSVVETITKTQEVVASCADKGVPVTVGVAGGRLESVRDVRATNLAGHPINNAARLAFLSDKPGWAAVEATVAEDALSATSKLKDALGPVQSGKVKRTDLEYRQLVFARLSFAEPKPDDSAQSELAHVVAYDVIRYSEQELADQVAFAEGLRARVDRALESSGGSRLKEGDERFYSPGGDGGVMVFRSGEKGGARAAWAFVRELQRHCAGEVSLRMGVASGQVVLLPDSLPVGRGVLLADEATRYPTEGGICVTKRFWDQYLERPDKTGWTSEPMAQNAKEYLLVNPQ